MLLIFGFGCSKQPQNIPAHIKNLENLTVYAAEAVPQFQIQLEHGQVFGDTDEVVIDQLTDFAVDDSGRVYIADANQDHVIAYTPKGDFLTYLGREGKGPGEFINLQDVQTSLSSLFAYDNNLKRIIVYSLDSLAANYTVNNIDGKYYVRNNGTFLKKATSIKKRKELENWDKIVHVGAYYFLNQEGQMISDTLFEMESHTRVVPAFGYSVGRPVGMYAKSVTALSNDNHIYQAWTSDFLIKVYGPNGAYQRAIYYPYERAPLSKSSASAAGIDEFKLKGFEEMDLPKAWPALYALRVDDQNQLWVATITKDEQVYQWWVLNEEGKLLAQFTWPRSKMIKIVKNGKLYVHEKNAKTGTQQIVRYGFEMDKDTIDG